jgi:hypothetical protein
LHTAPPSPLDRPPPPGRARRSSRARVNSVGSRAPHPAAPIALGLPQALASRARARRRELSSRRTCPPPALPVDPVHVDVSLASRHAAKPTSALPSAAGDHTALRSAPLRFASLRFASTPPSSPSKRAEKVTDRRPRSAEGGKKGRQSRPQRDNRSAAKQKLTVTSPSITPHTGAPLFFLYM